MSYRILSFDAEPTPRAGICIAERVYDAASVTGKPHHATVLGLLADWDRAQSVLTAASEQLSQKPKQHPYRPLSEVRLLAPVLYPGAIYAAGANYADHLLEMTRSAGRPPSPNMRELGQQPWHFVKTSRSSVVGPHSTVAIPNGCKALDWEVELAAVIGKRATKVSVDDALQYVAGYTIANDLSARDFLKRQSNAPTSPFFFDWIGHKCFDGSCPLGPWITPANDIENPDNLKLRLWVGDELMQDSSTSSMIFSIAEQISALSSRLTLHPGDVILTGTPAGVGSGRNRFLQPGEQVRLWIEKIGELIHFVA